MKAGIKTILINIAIMFAVLLAGLYVLFNIYLPNYTNHGETISVPDLAGMHKTELKEFLAQHSLRLKIADSVSYDKDEEPETVINQRPKAGTMVKENRRIYISINAKNIPQVEMPELTQISLFNATTEAQNLGLILDSIKYKRSDDDGLVLGQEYNGQKIKPGTKIPRGSIITLVVGRVGEKANVDVPDVIGMPLGLAKRTIETLGLVVGTPIWDETSEEAKGTVLKQRPSFGKTIQSGNYVDIWVAGTEEKEETEEE